MKTRVNLMKKHIRNSVKAVIIREGKILVLRKQDGVSSYAVLPGGGQKKGEQLPIALIRECQEEINAPVVVGELLFVRDYIADNHEFAEFSDHLHQVEFYFACTLPEHYQPSAGSRPDPGQFEVCWVPLNQLNQIGLYPRQLCRFLSALDDPTRPIYLGDVN